MLNGAFAAVTLPFMFFYLIYLFTGTGCDAVGLFVRICFLPLAKVLRPLQHDLLNQVLLEKQANNFVLLVIIGELLTNFVFCVLHQLLLDVCIIFDDRSQNR